MLRCWRLPFIYMAALCRFMVHIHSHAHTHTHSWCSIFDRPNGLLDDFRHVCDSAPSSLLAPFFSTPLLQLMYYSQIKGPGHHPLLFHESKGPIPCCFTNQRARTPSPVVSRVQGPRPLLFLFAISNKHESNLSLNLKGLISSCLSVMSGTSDSTVSDTGTPAFCPRQHREHPSSRKAIPRRFWEGATCADLSLVSHRISLKKKGKINTRRRCARKGGGQARNFPPSLARVRQTSQMGPKKTKEISRIRKVGEKLKRRKRLMPSSEKCT